MKRLIFRNWLYSLTLSIAWVVAALVNVAPASANHDGPCNQDAVGTGPRPQPNLNAMTEGGPSAPTWVKQCIQWYVNNVGHASWGGMWLQQDTFAGDPNVDISTTLHGGIYVSNGVSYASIGPPSRHTVTSTRNETNGQTNVLGFPSGNVWEYGQLTRGHSRGASKSVNIHTETLSPGRNTIRVNYTQQTGTCGSACVDNSWFYFYIYWTPQSYSNYGGNYGGNYGNYGGNYGNYGNYGGNYGNYSNYGGNYSNYYNPPPPPPPDPRIYISGAANGATVEPGGTLYFEISYANQGGSHLPGPVFPEGFNFGTNGSPDANSTVVTAWESNPDASCANVNSGGTAHGNPQHAYYCVNGGIPAGVSRGSMFYRVDVSPTATIGSQICAHADLNMGFNGGGSIHSNELCYLVVRIPFNIEVSMSICSPALSSSEIQPGQDYCMQINAQNTQPGYSDEVVVQIEERPPPGQTFTVSTGAAPSHPNTLNGFPAWDSHGYGSNCFTEITPACPPSPPNPNNYFFRDDRIDGFQSRNGNFYFDVPTTAEDGSRLCFAGYFYYKNQTHLPLISTTNPTEICWTVVNPRYPYLTTSRGDVHAGGGIGVGFNCPGSGGQITGRQGTTQSGTPGGTQATYVVSAGSSIDRASLFTPSSTSPIFLGSSGSYGRVCRPDLRQAVDRFRHDPPQKFRINGVGPVIDLTTAIPAPGEWLLAGNGAIATTGVQYNVLPGRRATVFVDGDITINGDICYRTCASLPLFGGPVARDQLPAFGIIATGSIKIAPGVRRLDGFYYAYGNIDTCTGERIEGRPGVDLPGNRAGGNNPTNAPCSQNLTVNGFMMANSFRFARTGPGRVYGLTPTPTENFRFLGDLYVAPPPGFVDNFSIRAIRPSVDTELPPLY